MARTQRDIVNYFPHDAHASMDSGTIAVLEGQFSNDGYAFWFKLLEKLASADGHFLDLNDPRRWQVLLSKAHIPNEKGVEIMKLLVEMGAIDKELWEMNKIIWCQKLVDNVADVYRNRKRELPLKPVITGNNPITTGDNAITMPILPMESTPLLPHTPLSPQIKLNKIKLITPKGGQRKAQSSTEKAKKDSIVNEIFAEMRTYLGYPEKVCGPGSPTPGEKKEAKDPIPNYGKEGKAIKRMLTRGFTREEILACWESKVSQRGGEFVSMVWVNEDIGKGEKQKRRPKELSTEAEIAASIKEVGP